MHHWDKLISFQTRKPHQVSTFPTILDRYKQGHHKTVVVNTYLPNQILSIMLTQASILATLVLSATSLSVENTKAASSLINCGCQCSSLTFLDSAGVEQGNCKTVDGTGAQWCYVDSTASTCQDLVPSQRFPHNPWSYQACATPAIGTTLCPAYNTVVEVADLFIYPVGTTAYR